jgi:hypothetical protein
MNDAAYRQYYDQLTDDQLIAILVDKVDLVPDAVAALEAEVQRRKVTLPEPIKWTRQPGSDEEVKSLEDYGDYQKLAEKRKSVSRYYYFVAVGPFVLGLLFARRLIENSTMFVVLTLGWGICAAMYCLSIDFRVLAYKCHNVPMSLAVVQSVIPADFQGRQSSARLPSPDFRP